jgi:PST family polysaccharide transporter
MATGVGARVVGLVGTLVLTRFIAPAEYGEVSAAVICVQTANQVTGFAVGQYLIANKSSAKIAFQGAAFHFVLGIVSLLVLLLFRGPLGIFLEAPDMGRFIPGFALALLIDRARSIPERLLVRELRFRTVAIVNGLGELTFTATALAMASRWGGYAIMAGALARSVLTFVLFMAKAPRAEWLVPSRFEGAVFRRFLSYGTPIMLASIADRAASTWDNLIILRLFGARLMGCYALSYSLAETPLIYVAERMGDVLMPTFSKMEPDERPAAVVRAAGLMSLVVAPLGVGLGAVAPTLVSAFFDARWAEMASILAVLSVMTVFQPAPWSAIAYLQAEKLTRLIMVTSIGRAVVMLSLIPLLGSAGGPVWACVGVGLGFVVHAVATVLLTARVTPLPAGAYLLNVMRPMLACIPMFLAITALRPFLASIHMPVALRLTSEVLCGGVVYVGAAFVLARSNVRELIGMVRRSRGPSP